VSANIQLTQAAGGAFGPLRRAFERAACAALAAPRARPQRAVARSTSVGTEPRAAGLRCR